MSRGGSSSDYPLAEGCQVRANSLRSRLPDMKPRPDRTHGRNSIRRKVIGEQLRGLRV
jgi:hypothetical protein